MTKITESRSRCRSHRVCFIECGSKPVLLVDAVEIFLRLLDLSENQKYASRFSVSVELGICLRTQVRDSEITCVDEPFEG